MRSVFGAALLLLCTAAGGAQRVVETAPGGSTAHDDPPFYLNSFDKTPSAAAVTALGRALFFDPTLSASGSLACASCHDPAHAFASPDPRAVERGGPDRRLPGVRAVPSLMYEQNMPPFTEHFFDDDGNDSVDQGPAGGTLWDGRAQSAHEQARVPLLSEFEMANSSAAAVVAKVARAPYAAQFRRAFGASVFDSQERAFKALLLALETFEESPADFYPYSSKYDAFLRGTASLSAAERRGLEAFNDPARGNCARCHPSAIREGAFPQFTDFGFAALGAPRNPAIPANADPRYFDLGVCGPLRKDLAARAEYCGLFRTPTLRNVARKRVYLHNGVFHALEDVVRFYAERDTAPEKWYPRSPSGVAMKFDDLPHGYRKNVDEQPPFGRRAGEAPALSDDDVRDIVAFLNALSDGYAPVEGWEKPTTVIRVSY
ncbi:MAG: cytochrome c peroxidase [Steroidobacteraceae bacterium]